MFDRQIIVASLSAKRRDILAKRGLLCSKD